MTIKFGVSGEQGSFSEEAALSYAKEQGMDVNLVYLIDMMGVLDALNKGLIDQGIFPVVNSQGGLVKSAFLAMGSYPFQYIDEIWLHVDQCLLGLPEIGLNNIEQVVSHPQGLLQCKHYLAKMFPGVKQLSWVNTAQAARKLAEGYFDSNSVVIASKRSAKLYGLKILAENIQDSDVNLTAFIIVKRGVHHVND